MEWDALSESEVAAIVERVRRRAESHVPEGIDAVDGLGISPTTAMHHQLIQGELAMQYLLMCCFDERSWMSLPDEQRNKIMGEYGQWVESLKKNGKLLGGAKLDQCASAVTVRHQNGEPAVTDGPFAETKEQLGGYHLLECKDREEALELAARIPTLPLGGTIEVRPVLHLE